MNLRSTYFFGLLLRSSFPSDCNDGRGGVLGASMGPPPRPQRPLPSFPQSVAAQADSFTLRQARRWQELWAHHAFTQPARHRFLQTLEKHMTLLTATFVFSFWIPHTSARVQHQTQGSISQHVLGRNCRRRLMGIGPPSKPALPYASTNMKGATYRAGDICCSEHLTEISENKLREKKKSEAALETIASESGANTSKHPGSVEPAEDMHRTHPPLRGPGPNLFSTRFSSRVSSLTSWRRPAAVKAAAPSGPHDPQATLTMLQRFSHLLQVALSSTTGTTDIKNPLSEDPAFSA